MTLKIRIATRKSELALRQVDIVKSYFGEDVETETIKVTTSGDKILNKSLFFLFFLNMHQQLMVRLSNKLWMS